MGQVQIPFLGGTYNGRSTNIDASRAVNWYPELTQTTDNKATINMVGTPGLNLFDYNIYGNGNPVRALYTFSGISLTSSIMFSVVYNKVYMYKTGLATVVIGTLNSTSGQVDFADNGASYNGVGGNQVMIVDGSDGYIYNISTGAFSTIARAGGWADLRPLDWNNATTYAIGDMMAWNGGLYTALIGGLSNKRPDTFPAYWQVNPALQVEFQDGYFIVSNGTMKYWVSNLYDGTTWGALATASVVATGDNIQSVLGFNQQMYFIKTLSTEIWYDAGTPTASGSPYSRVQGAVYPFGTFAPASVAKGGSKFYFLCSQRSGDGSEVTGVAAVTTSEPSIISPPAINYRISQSVSLNRCFGYCYSDQGHQFYVLTNPEVQSPWTLVYDVTTNMWHERMSSISDSFTTARHIANCYTFYNGKHLVGDYRTSAIHEMSSAYVTDNGEPIYSYRTAQTIVDTSNYKDIFIDRLIIDAETGVGTNSGNTGDTGHYTVAGYSGLSTDTLIGTYSGATAYVVGNLVLYSGTYYRCIQNGTGQQPDISPAYWTLAPIVLNLANGVFTAGGYLIGVVNPTAYLSWSNDGGHTWSAEYGISMGTQGAYTQRLIWRRLGRARDRVFKIRISDPIKKLLINSYVEGGA